MAGLPEVFCVFLLLGAREPVCTTLTVFVQFLVQVHRLLFDYVFDVRTHYLFMQFLLF